MADDATGPITQDAALAMLADVPHAGGVQEPEEQPQAAEQADAPEHPAESPAEPDQDAPEETPAGDDPNKEAEVADPQERVVVEPPQNWDAAARARFQTLDPETQSFLREQYDAGERAVGQKFEEASAARKAAETEANGIRELKTRLDALVPQAEQALQSKWARVDWVAWAQQDPEACMQGRMQYEAEARQLQQLDAARQDAESKAYKAFVDEQLPEMARIIPGLAKRETAQAYMDKMMSYAKSQGATDQQLKYASAKEWSMLDKARLWDESQAKLSANPPPRVAPAVAAKPVAAQAPQAPQQRRVNDIRGNLKKTGSMSDAAALVAELGL